MSKESAINIQLVHGGFIFTSEGEEGCYKTEVFTSQGKLMKAVRTALEGNSLVGKTKDEVAETAADKHPE